MGVDVSNEYRRTYVESIKVAGLALKAARREDELAAVEHLMRLNQLDSPGTNAIANAAVFWIDALRYHMLGGKALTVEMVGCGVMESGQRGQRYVLGSAKADTELRPSALWAADAINARLSDDLARFEQVWERAPVKADQWMRYVADLLFVVANTIRSTEFGYALKEATLE